MAPSTLMYFVTHVNQGSFVLTAVSPNSSLLQTLSYLSRSNLLKQRMGGEFRNTRISDSPSEKSSCAKLDLNVPTLAHYSLHQPATRDLHRHRGPLMTDPLCLCSSSWCSKPLWLSLFVCVLLCSLLEFHRYIRK